MKFIRKNGRIIPIRNSAAAAGATYALSRIPVKSANKRLEVARRRARMLEPKGLDIFPRVKPGMKLDKLNFAKVYGSNAIPTKIATVSSVRKFQKQGQPFVIKPRDGAMGSMSDFHVNSGKDAVPLSAIKKSNLIQPKLNFSHEYRVMTAHGTVTSVTHRRLPGSTLPVGAYIPVIKGRKEISEFVESALKAGNKLHPTKTGILGIDIGRTESGLKMIEANIAPGDILNPLKNLKAKAYGLGRLSNKWAIAIAGAVGIAAYLASRKNKK